ncbi:hypothetical protein HYX19_02705 [Candidatus Woesearchaeota archaeon]|nr:hypothetical protein [Candidatus Woesearchaeota archaeon]
MDRKYVLKEITPAHLMCAPFPGCPAIYEVVRIEECIVGACPAIYGSKDDEKVYIIVGKKKEPKEVGLEKKVAQDEACIEIPRSLLSKLLNKP